MTGLQWSSIPHCHFYTAVLFIVPRASLVPLVTRCCESVLRASGYYKTASAAGPCTSCESNNGSVTGVKGCASCAAPTGSTGPVLCYLVKESTGGANLSSGAIAGISIAVIAVVGGLVGFLCWWFICRGKA